MAEKTNTLPQTKGAFKLRGIVTGMSRPEAYSSKAAKSGRDMHTLSFGVQTSKNNIQYVRMSGVALDMAKFTKYNNATKKNDAEQVPWKKRNEFKKEGYTPQFGIVVSLDKDGKSKRSLFSYDACAALATELTDGMSVFITGTIDVSSRDEKDNDGNPVTRSYTTCIPTGIYATKTDVDFEAADFEEENTFKQRIVFMGAEKDDDDYVINAKIVKYGDVVENIRFYCAQKLWSGLKANLKPYHSIDVVGRLESVVSAEAQEDDEKSEQWFDTEDTTVKHFERIQPRRKRLTITNADKASWRKDEYSKETIEKTQQAKEDFGGDGSDWGADDGDAPWED